MAKESMITRTIKSSHVTILCLDIDSGEPVNRSFDLPRERKNEKEILKAVTPLLADEPNIRPVHVVDVTINEKLYGMTESQFMAMAKPIERKTPAESNN